MVEEIFKPTPLIEKLIQERDVALEFQQRKHEHWTDNYSLYRDYVEVNRLTQRQAVNFPIMKETIKTLLSRIDDPPSIYFKCLESKKAGAEKEIVLNELWDYCSNKLNYEGLDILDKKNVLLCGRSFKKLNFLNGEFYTEVLDNYDILIDPKVNPLDIETARWIIHQHIFKTLREILANPKYTAKGKEELKKYLDTKEGIIKSEDTEETLEAKQERLSLLGVENFEEFGATDVLVELKEHYTYVWDPKKKIFVRTLVIWAADQVELFQKPLKDVIGVEFYPFVTWGDDVDISDFWSDGVADLVRVPNKLLNMWLSQMLENRSLRNYSMNWFDCTRPDFVPQTYEPKPFGMYPCPGDPNKLIKQIEIPDLGQTVNEIIFIRSLVERACYSEDTETLTENGWKFYWEIQDNEKIATFNPKKRKIEYHLPIKKYIYDYEGEMYHYHKDKSVDLLVSPEHKIWYRKVGHREPSEWMLKPANEIKENNIEFLISADWDGKEKEMMILPRVEYLKQKKKNKEEIKIKMDTWLEFLGYILSEGGMDVKGGFKNHYNLNIAQGNEENIKKIRSCLTKLPFKFTEHRDKNNYARFDIANKTLWIWLYQNVGPYCNEKRIPKEFKNLSKRQLKILFDAYMLGDGSIDKRKNRNCGNASSVSKKLTDDLQEIGLKLGYKSKSIERQDKRGGNRKVSWKISFTFDNSVKSMITPELRLKKDLTIEKYKGKIYCFEVPNHLFVTRRNGLISIQGNTAATAIEKGVAEKKQITLGEVEMLAGKSAERIVSMAKAYRKAWKQFAEKWFAILDANVSAVKTVKLYKESYTGKVFEKEIKAADWKSEAGYKVQVLSSSEQEEEKITTLQKWMALRNQFPDNLALQKIAQRRILESMDLTPDELKEVMAFEEQRLKATTRPPAPTGEEIKPTKEIKPRLPLEVPA